MGRGFVFAGELPEKGTIQHARGKKPCVPKKLLEYMRL
jgi:hypothetical protein